MSDVSELFVAANFIGRSLLLNPGGDDVVVEVGGYRLIWSSKKIVYSDISGNVLFSAFERGNSLVVEDSDGKQKIFEKGNIPVQLTMYFQRLGLAGSDWPINMPIEEMSEAFEGEMLEDADSLEAESADDLDDALIEEEVSSEDLGRAKDAYSDPFKLLVLKVRKKQEA